MTTHFKIYSIIIMLIAMLIKFSYYFTKLCGKPITCYLQWLEQHIKLMLYQMEIIFTHFLCHHDAITNSFNIWRTWYLSLLYHQIETRWLLWRKSKLVRSPLYDSTYNDWEGPVSEISSNSISILWNFFYINLLRLRSDLSYWVYTHFY